MKITIDDEAIYELSESALDCLHYYINSESSDQIIKDTIIWAISSYFEGYKEKIKAEWIPILFKRVSHIPTNESELLDLIRSQPDYLTKKQKEEIEKAKREGTFKVE